MVKHFSLKVVLEIKLLGRAMNGRLGFKGVAIIEPSYLVGLLDSC